MMMVNLCTLESLLGVRYADCISEGSEVVVLSAEGRRHLNETVDAVGTTRLMQASREGEWQSVHLLLLCGAEVNACDDLGWRAIDHSLSGGGSGVTLMLLERDSVFPTVPSGTWRAFVGLEGKEFLEGRDVFHEKLSTETIECLEWLLKSPEGHSADNSTRYWVNSAGQSALWTAAKGRKYDAWALLKAYGFSCTTAEEKNAMAMYNSDKGFSHAMSKYFVEPVGIQVQKMAAKSTVFHGHLMKSKKGDMAKIMNFFKDIDEEEWTSDLLKCLQDDSGLKVTFNFLDTDIRRMGQFDYRCHVYGMTDLKENWVYVVGKTMEDFDFTCAVSNLVHELAHKALSDVFENGGLPYRVGDTSARDEYNSIVDELFSADRIQECDEVIRRARDSLPLTKYHEVIVRVPEMISRYKDRGGGQHHTEDGFSRLERQAPRLLEYYRTRVVQAIKGYVRRSGGVWDIAIGGEGMPTEYFDPRIQVRDDMEEPETHRHGRLRVMRASNLKLAVSHLQSSWKEVSFMNWTRFQERRNNMKGFSLSGKRLVIIWDVPSEPYFCRNVPVCLDMGCVARQLEAVAHGTILLLPKGIPVLPDCDCIDYTWTDLASESKNVLLEKELYFGRVVKKLKDAFEEGLSVELLHDPGFVSKLIDSQEIGCTIPTP